MPIEVEGIKGERYVLAGELTILDEAGAELAADLGPGGRPPGAAFLAPLDPFAWDRDLLRSLYDFDYVWEVYVPEKKRRWGYYVLPILFGDRLVGRIEPRIDRKADASGSSACGGRRASTRWRRRASCAAFAAALEAHRGFGGVRRIVLPRTHAPPAVRGRRPRRLG